ncbi:hypothetical protein TNCV_4027321 [Trichonephila clavipes]|nr:hypothetical protein TNCV_4027321 [Trichonephila clavipes]
MGGVDYSGIFNRTSKFRTQLVEFVFFSHHRGVEFPGREGSHAWAVNGPINSGVRQQISRVSKFINHRGLKPCISALVLNQSAIITWTRQRVRSRISR